MTYKHKTLAVVIASVLAGCNAEDNTTIGNGGSNTYPPVVAKVSIPTLYANSTVEGIYQITDPNQVPRPVLPEEELNLKWYEESDTELKNPVHAGKSFDLTYDHLGMMLKFCVEPKVQGTVNTVGEVECSDAKEVQDALGEKPTVSDAQIDNNSPRVGNKLVVTWVYDHVDLDAEGKSEVTWFAGDKEIATTYREGDSSSSSLMLAAKMKGVITEEQTIKAVVRGKTVTNLESEKTTEVVTTGKVGIKEDDSAPTFTADPQIVGQPYVGMTLSVNIDEVWHDEDGDAQGQHKYQWTADNVNIDSATASTFTIPSDDETYAGKFIGVTVQLVAETGEKLGETRKVKMNEAVTVPTVEKPTIAAGSLGYTMESDSDKAVVGAILTGTYTYEQAEGFPQGDSTAYWSVIDPATKTTTQEPCDVASECSITVKQEHLGKKLDFCVTPVTANNVSGQQYCLSDDGVNKEVTTYGISISGNLEYSGKLIATLYGYKDDVRTQGGWWIDTTGFGPENDGDKELVVEGNTLIIGDRNGITTDMEWYEKKAESDLDARSFVGKSVEFRLTTSDGTIITENASAHDLVTGGMKIDSDNRVIEPTRFISMTDADVTVEFHRPLTPFEYEKLTGKASAEQVVIVDGIGYQAVRSLAPQEGSEVISESVKYCKAMGEKWNVPANYFGSGYEKNALVGNSLVNTATTNYSNLRHKIMGADDNNLGAYLASPVFGWPLSIYTSSSWSPKNKGFHAIKFFDGMSTNPDNQKPVYPSTLIKPGDSKPEAQTGLVSCVSVVTN